MVREGGTRLTISKISHNEKGVSVITDRGEFQADRAVITLPLGVLKKGTVEFDPAVLEYLREIAGPRLVDAFRAYQDEEDGPVDLKVEDQAILEDFERRIEERAIKRLEKDHGRKN